MDGSLIIRGDAGRIPLPAASVDLCFGSPPYVDARLYLEDGQDLGIARGLEEWVSWMLRVTDECLRVSRGAVVWVAAGKTKDRSYWPACEALMSDWSRKGVGSGVFLDGLELPARRPGECSMYRPCYWNRVGIPGSGHDQWFRADVEYVMCFKRPGPLPWAENTAMGHPPKWAPGGAMNHRLSDGARVNQWGGRETSAAQRTASGARQEPGRPSHRSRSKMEALAAETTEPQTLAYLNGELPEVPGMKLNTKRLPDGDQRVKVYIPPAKANPGNLIRTVVGGNQLGSPFAHENEAPFPEDLAEFFIRSLVPPGGVVFDPFSGSATTVATALKCDRRGIGMDLRMSQCLLGRRRVAEGQRPVSRLDPGPAPAPLPGQMSLFPD